MKRGRWLACGAAALALLALLASGTARTAEEPELRPTPGSASRGAWSGGYRQRLPQIPTILFVTRHRAPGDSIVPGLGPRGRTIATGGTLYVRPFRGEIRPFLEVNPFFDVADPAVSWDGKRVAFAATVAPDSAWRIWVTDDRGRDLRPVTRSDRALDLSRWGRVATKFERYDDFDPTWLPDGTICFASTRYPMLAGDGEPASNLFVIHADGNHLRRITSERHGAEEPTVDPRTGLIVYARWWRNAHLASDQTPNGLTTERGEAVPADPVDLWHAISIHVQGGRGRLAGGNPRVRGETIAYQPCVLGDGTLVGVRTEPSSLETSPRQLWLQGFPSGFSPAKWVPGVRERRGERQPVRACAPAAINDRRVLIAAALDSTNDFDICLVSVAALDEAGDEGAEWNGPEGIWLIAGTPGMHDLDPAILAPRKLPPVFEPYATPLPMTEPPLTLAEAYAQGASFRFDCMNTFESGPIDFPTPDAPSFERDVRIRFFAALPRPDEATGDTAVVVRESDVQPGGGIHEDSMPSDIPMFEQLISAHQVAAGHRVLRVEDGPAHVPGMNVTRFGTGTQCVGCHRGHSVLPVPDNYATALRFNASPSAQVTASSVAPGTAGERAAVDRRARGNPARVGWIADSNVGQWVRLEWQTAIEVDTLILYALRRRWPDSDLNVREVEVALIRGGQTVATERVRGELAPHGTRIPLRGTRVDALEVRPLRSSGNVMGHPRVGIAEIETRARIAIDR